MDGYTSETTDNYVEDDSITECADTKREHNTKHSEDNTVMDIYWDTKNWTYKYM